MSGFAGLLGELPLTVLEMIRSSFQFALVYLLLQVLLRRDIWTLAGLASFYGLAGVLYTRTDFPIWLVLFILAVQLSLLFSAWVRFGLLTDCVARLVFVLVLRFPVNPDLSVWYSGVTLFVVFAVIGLALYGFVTSTAGQPWLREEALAS